MVDLGMAALGVFMDDGQPAPRPEDDESDQNEHMVVLKVTTPHGALGLCFHRGQFSKLLASPNADEAIECSITMEGAYGRPESE